MNKTDCLSEYLKWNINNFYKAMQQEYNRYNSWEHCFIFFQKYKDEKSRNKMSTDDLNLAALNLAFYLASWGMYRGSSFLLQYDYKIFIPLIEELFKTEILNNNLWDINNIENLNLNSYLESLEKANEIISKHLGRYSNLKKQTSKNNFNIGTLTETLVTKILMGIYGCVPAFDRFFCNGIDELKKKYFKTNSLLKRYNRDSLMDLVEFVKLANEKNVWLTDNNENYKLHNDKNINYPIMKLVDMCFWQIGFNNSFKSIEIKEDIVILHRKKINENKHNKVYQVNTIIKDYSDKEKTCLIDDIGNKKIQYSDKESANTIIETNELINFIKNGKCFLLRENLKNDIHNSKVKI